MTKGKTKNNTQFVLTVALMITLIVALMVPTTIAWFTDNDRGVGKTNINLGSVAIATGEQVEFVNQNSSTRGLYNILPGDSITFNFEVYNAGNVDSYAKINFQPKIIYGETDITDLLYDTTTDPENQPYWRVDNLTSILDTSFYENGSETNQVFVLTKDETLGNGKTITGVLEFSLTLPNSVTDGTNTYVLNGAKSNVKLVLEINMATIQKDNNTIETASTELSNLVKNMQPNYSFSVVNGIPTLMLGNTAVKTESYYEVSSSGDTKAYAFIAEVDGQKTLLAVVGEGNMNNYTSTTQPWRDARSNITEVTIEDGITSIGNYSFYNCDSLTSVTIPESVTAIGNYAFQGCKSLESVTIPNSVVSVENCAFQGCTSLTSVTISDGVTSIGKYAFRNCTSLESVIIPDSVTAIGEGSFAGCSGFIVGANNQTYHSKDNCLIETSTNTLISGGKTSIIPNYVTKIGNYAFNNCDSLTSVTIPESVTSIGEYTFNSCDSLTSVTIPESVTSIGENAFSYCTSLTSVTIPDSVTYFRDYAFSHCTSLKSVTLGKGATRIGNYAFSTCTSLESVIIPEGVTHIGQCTFEYCESLTSVTIPESVTNIGYYAFRHCTSLTSVTIPDSVTAIGEYAFSYCTSLTSVTIPDSVTFIGKEAFSNCTSLTSIYMCRTSSDGVKLGTSWYYNNANVYYYSETYKAGCWHYDTDGTTPVIW